MASFHCNTCAVGFADRDAMLRHYDSTLHNDNVKRRVAGLVPLTATAHSVRSSRAATSVASTSYKCTICDKKFGTAQTLSSHLQSQKHKERKARKKLEKETGETEQPTPVEEEPEEPSWEATAIRVSPNEDLTNMDCLFCNIRAPSIEDSLIHMAQKHNFTIPLADDVADYTGLLSYLAMKVNGCLCLVCGADTKYFETREGVQNHMAAVGHQMLVLNEGEYAEFYQNPEIFAEREPAGASAQNDTLVLPSGRTLVSKHEYKNHQAPVMPAAADDEGGERKMITMQEKAHMTTVQMNRYKALIAMREKMSGPKAKQEQRQHVREQQKQRMRLGVHLNCLHGKGYQGDYVGKTL